ncbi:hypothetical protein cypCar_00046687 [Cyprinus carpio]|nr:hypothetical protein cypCar_00046687 [Cyprinus carpio]
MESDCSDASSFATERSFEVEDFSPPPSPEVEDVEVSGDTGQGTAANSIRGPWFQTRERLKLPASAMRSIRRMVLASHEARMVASTIPKFRLWWLADEERGAMKTAMVQESRLLHKEPSEDAGTTGNAAVGGDPEDDENFFTF